jgi:dihydrolipoamide dehydrogenase
LLKELDMTIKLTIIGAGPGGYVAAIRAAQKGAQVTLVESGEVGGNCLNRGCIPTKALIASAEALEHARHASDFGVEVNGAVGYSLVKVRERKDKIVATQAKGIRGLFKNHGVHLIEGRGSLLSPDVVRVVRNDGMTMDLKSDKTIIATGSSPAQLPSIPFDGEQIISSDDAVQFKKIPRSLLIIGAGVIGSEFAFIYRTFGSDVTVVEILPRALSTEDEEMSGIIEREFKKSKIKLLVGTKVVDIRKDDGMVVAALSNGQSIRTEMVLVSIGRLMNSDNLGLENIGVATGVRREILANERLETTIQGIYAIGDVTNKILLAHVAYHQGLIAVENALGGNNNMDYSVVPSGIFTMPEIGSVGLREHEAVDRGIVYKVGKFPYRALGKAHAMGEITGLVKIISDKRTDKVLGMHICGAHATDLIHEGALAIKMGVTARELGGMIHAHPTLAEAVMEAAEDVHRQAIHVLQQEN